MKNLGGVLGGKNERISIEDCTRCGASVGDGGSRGSIEDPVFDCLLRQCLWTRTVALFGDVFVAVVSLEVKRYMLLGPIIVRGYYSVDRFIGWLCD